jgi:DEAD/DEAH box helicase domain-containing protein
MTMHTTSFWWELSESFCSGLLVSDANLGEGLTAVANVLENVVPVWIMTDPRDLRTYPMVRSPFSNRPTIYIYENIPAGVGYSKKIFTLHIELLRAAYDLIARCTCESGCPSCVGPALDVGQAGKKHALDLLHLALEAVEGEKPVSRSV